MAVKAAAKGAVFILAPNAITTRAIVGVLAADGDVTCFDMTRITGWVAGGRRGDNRTSRGD
jgi:hypothetical protein